MNDGVRKPIQYVIWMNSWYEKSDRICDINVRTPIKTVIRMKFWCENSDRILIWINF
jgi:hypothetical protein